MKITQRAIDSIRPYARNARTHTEAQVKQIAASIKEFGWTNPLLIAGDGSIIAGHARLAAARLLGMTAVPVIILDHLTETQRRALVLADNRLALNAGWDEEMLGLEIAALRDADFDLSLLGFDADELETAGERMPAASLADQFIVPPFSVLDARQGYWQARKTAWLALGIRSELGRGPDAAPGGSSAPDTKLVVGKTVRHKGFGHARR